MRYQTREFVIKFLETHKDFVFKNVLDVGFANVEGKQDGTIKDLFKGKNYLGIDLNPIDNVNMVLDMHDIKKKLKKESSDIVCCFDTLEHDDKFWVTIENMKWVLPLGGYLLIGVPSRYCPKHDHPKDYWRFMENGVETFFDDMDDVYIEVQKTKDEPFTAFEDEIYGWGRKI